MITWQGGIDFVVNIDILAVDQDFKAIIDLVCNIGICCFIIFLQPPLAGISCFMININIWQLVIITLDLFTVEARLSHKVLES